MIRVIIADDHVVVRHGLKKILANEIGLSVDGEAGNVGELLEKLETTPCDVLILDISMPGATGLTILPELRQRYPHVAVLVLSMHPEDQFGIASLRAGAYGFLNKESAADELIDAVRKISSGRRFVSATLAEKLAEDVGSDTGRPPHELLSPREYRVMCEIARGKSVSQIAEELALSVKTVSTFRTRILQKLQLKNNGEIMRYALRQRLVE